jgi:hypothetical protein
MSIRRAKPREEEGNEEWERGEDGLGLPSSIYQAYYTFS